MEEFKGTKGEWKSIGYESDSNGYISVGFPDGSITIYGGCTDSMNYEEKQKHIEKSEANANLIASAPDLLEALQMFVDFVYKQKPEYESAMVKLAKKAIQKALK